MNEISMKGLDAGSKLELCRYMPLLKKTLGLEQKYRKMKNKKLAAVTQQFRDEYDHGKDLDDLLPDAFAAVREASRRVTGLFPFPVQVLGAIALYKGRIAEMKTGEGKTLVAAMPSYLMALAGRGVHVVTVNDYLARVGQEDIGRIHAFLGLTTGCVQSGMGDKERRDAYACDITYVTNSELGFDYLRDNRAASLNDRVLRELFYAIIDEVDSVLIDEARTPLIISGAAGNPDQLTKTADMFVRTLEKGEFSGELTKADAMAGRDVEETGDYVADEKNRQVHLTKQGIRRAETAFGLANYADPAHARLRHAIQMALQAYGLLKKDRDYVVHDGQVIIVDEFTGRLMPDRRFQDGLHQALEAKEQVEIHEEQRTLATITYQNFFNKFRYKCGMTGTAMTSAEEFKTIYGLKPVMIPTNMPMIRVDEPDAVYMTHTAKIRAVTEEVVRVHKTGQPILVGTTSIHDSEELSDCLKDFHIPHSVLNARHYAEEAAIVAKAGQMGAVTIATNMAGRGTDIRLGDGVAELGGLYVIGTQRHEARRIDLQLRGRSGRQGDPGRSKFYLSLEDDVMRLFGAETMLNMLRQLDADPWAPLGHTSVPKLASDAQKKIENLNFGLRKSLLDFDEVNNEHRELFYAQRDAIMYGSNPDKFIQNLVCDVAEDIVSKYWQAKHVDYAAFQSYWNSVFPESVAIAHDEKKMRDIAIQSAQEQYRAHLLEFPLVGEIHDMERRVILRIMDWNWISHLERLQYLREAVSFSGYGQRNPVTVYREKSYGELMRMVDRDRRDIVKLFFRTHPATA